MPQQIPGGDIYPALEKGTIDAAEWVGPYDDEKLGLYKVAKYYYYPGWWEGGPELDLFVNNKAWDELPKDYQSILEARVLRGERRHDGQVRRAQPAGAEAAGRRRREAARRSRTTSWRRATRRRPRSTTDIATKNAKFKKVYEPWKKFRDEQISWFQVAENRFDNFMIAAGRMAQRPRANSRRPVKASKKPRSGGAFYRPHAVA